MERKLLISGLTIGYEGLFDSSDFFRLIEDWFRQNGYEKHEAKHIERVSEKGKTIDMEIRPFKDLNEYTRYEIYIRIIIKNLADAKIKKGKEEFKINRGKISISMDAYLATDIKHTWESKPLLFFFRTIFNKFIGREYIGEFEKGLMNDLKNFHSEMKSYLNLQRYSQQA